MSLRLPPSPLGLTSPIPAIKPTRPISSSASTRKTRWRVSRKQAELADQANNKANAKTPDIAALLAANKAPVAQARPC